ncbi:MAG: hypothetical protein IPP72_06305 [Chitinophagaceae bacterium]|nr:hypothetical protein [Chitinophagaceae bacterium]
MKREYLIIMIFVSILGMGKESYCQDCPPQVNFLPLPDMFITKAKGAELLDEFSKDRLFNKSKYSRIKDINILKSSSFSFVFRWTAFNDLVHIVPGYDSMRIHFAVYHECNIDHFPSIEGPKLVLLFSPEVAGNNPQRFYFISGKDGTIHEVPLKCAKSWISDFETFVQVELRKTIDSGDTDNEDQTVNDKFSDTKSIVYAKEKFEEAFIVEQEYQRTHHCIEISAIKIDLSAYTNKGRDIKASDPDQKHVYKKRLLIQFNYLKPNFTSGIDELIDLEEQDDYQSRLDLSLSQINSTDKNLNLSTLSIEEKEQKRAIDNGQLCPTHCPPPPPSGGLK